MIVKRILLPPCLLIVVATTVVGQQIEASHWKRYTVRGEAFSVSMPAVPAMATYPKRSVERVMKERRERMLGAYADGLVYIVGCFENSEPQESLEEFIEREIFTHNGWDRSSEQDLKRNGFSGKQYNSPNTVPGTMQIFATGDAFYRFEVFGAPADDARVKQYFASVILGRKTPGIEVSDGLGVAYVPVTPSDVFMRKDVDRKPVLLMRPEPSYTEEARRHALAGQVILKAVFASDGSVRDIRVASGLPDGLTEKAVDAARKIKFIPAVKNGRFVSMPMQLEYNFSHY